MSDLVDELKQIKARYGAAQDLDNLKSAPTLMDVLAKITASLGRSFSNPVRTAEDILGQVIDQALSERDRTVLRYALAVGKHPFPEQKQDRDDDLRLLLPELSESTQYRIEKAGINRIALRLDDMLEAAERRKAVGPVPTSEFDRFVSSFRDARQISEIACDNIREFLGHKQLLPDLASRSLTWSLWWHARFRRMQQVIFYAHHDPHIRFDVTRRHFNAIIDSVFDDLLDTTPFSDDQELALSITVRSGTDANVVSYQDWLTEPVGESVLQTWREWLSACECEEVPSESVLEMRDEKRRLATIKQHLQRKTEAKQQCDVHKFLERSHSFVTAVTEFRDH